jgi:hypothetical protein
MKQAATGTAAFQFTGANLKLRVIILRVVFKPNAAN